MNTASASSGYCIFHEERQGHSGSVLPKVTEDELCRGKPNELAPNRGYNPVMERKIFWGAFTILGIAADVVLPIWWALGATIPIVYVSWWIAYRSGWFE